MSVEHGRELAWMRDGGCDKLLLALWAESAAERVSRGVAQPG
jgi:hypothetical protein